MPNINMKTTSKEGKLLKTASKKTVEVKRMKIKNDKLVIDDCVIGDEEYVLSQFEKAVKYDELKATFNMDGDA